MTLFDYQQKSVDHLYPVLASGLPALDASDAGTGKTYVGCALAARFDEPTLVVSPKIARSIWERTAKLFDTELSTINYEMLRTGKTPFGYWKTRQFNGKTIKQKFVFSPEVKFLIFDEAHRASGMNTENSKILAAAAGRRCLLISGTLADDLFKLGAASGLLGLRKPEQSYWQWLVNKGCRRAHFGGLEVRGGEPEHRKILHKIHTELFPARGVRVKIADLGDAFPETQITAELYSISEAGRIDELYATVADSIAELHKKREVDEDCEHALTKILRARQEIELLKLPIFTELAQDAVDSGRSVAIFLNFSESIRWITERLGTTCIVNGTIHPQVKEANVAKFQADTSRIIVCNSDAGGECISLHDVRGQFPRTALVSAGYSATKLGQLLHRVHRAAGVSKSQQRIIFIDGSVEVDVHRAVSSSLDKMETLMDGALNPRNLVLQPFFQQKLEPVLS